MPESGREVSNNAVLVILGGCHALGHDPTGLLDCFGLARDAVVDRQGRCAWRPFVEFVTRAERLIGGSDAFEAAMYHAVMQDPGLQVVPGMLPPEYLFTGVFERMHRTLFAHIGVRAELVSPTMARWELLIPKSYVGCPAIFHATVGVARAYPRFLGLADAKVTANIASHRARFDIQLPESKPMELRLQQLAKTQVETLKKSGESGSTWAVTNLLAGGAPDVEQPPIALFRQAKSLEQVGEALFGLLESKFCATGLVIEPAGRLTFRACEFGAKLPAACTTRALFVGDHEVAWITTDSPRRILGIDPPELAAILPYVALLIEQYAGSQGAGTQAFVTRIAGEWSLTERQTEVLALMICGCSNKDIAAALAISVRGVENHVRKLMMHVGAASRAEFLSRLHWTG
jgi:DNA-binding CsgD family transcriptional regulator